MLYVHIPYCHHKCTYCAFYSVARPKDTDSYVDALCLELKARKTDTPLRTVYFGGGTPTMLTLEQLHRIVDTIRDGYNLSLLEEATIEANPENLVPEYLEGLANLHFFNRISIGIQSFSDDELKMLNRVHTSQQAYSAILNVAAAGFDNVSVDLIMGLPHPYGVGLQYSLDHLDEFLPLGVIKHLSCYELTVEPGTMLERQLKTGRLQLCYDEDLASQYDMLLSWCQNNGFEQYEVSNFGKPGYHSRHNSRYWNRTPYIGVGAGAHSFDGSNRRWNLPDISRYIIGAGAGNIPFEEEKLTSADAFNEYIMTALRTVNGVDKNVLASLVSTAELEGIKPKIDRLVKIGLIAETETHFQPTSSGLLQADGIAASLFL